MYTCTFERIKKTATNKFVIQGRVVQKPVNIKPGLKVTTSINCYGKQMFLLITFCVVSVYSD